MALSINQLIGKHALELNYPGDGRLFLNYWDWMHGDDVVAEIVDGKIMLSQYDDDGNELPEKEITFSEFLALVETSIKNI